MKFEKSKEQEQKGQRIWLWTYSFMYTHVIYSVTVIEMVENNKMKRFCLIVVKEQVKA